MTLREWIERELELTGNDTFTVGRDELTETAEADAEILRLAEIGRAMHELLDPFTKDSDLAHFSLHFNGVDAYCCWQEDDEGGVINRVEGDTLLDALRALSEKCEVK